MTKKNKGYIIDEKLTINDTVELQTGMGAAVSGFKETHNRKKNLICLLNKL